MGNETVNPPENQPNENQPAGKRSWTAFFMLLTTLLAVAALLSAGFIYYTSEKFKTGNRDDFQRTTEQLQAIENSVIDLEQREQGSTHRLNEVVDRQTQLAAGLQALYQDRKHSSLDWALTEVEHLLISAIQRLTLQGDVKSTLVIMQSADSRLQDLADPSLLPVRRQLTMDINALRSVKEVDISGMGLYLADIITRAEQLPIREINIEQTPAAATAGAESPDLKQLPAWRKLLSVIWQELKGLVTISEQGRGAIVSLLPEQRYYLYQNLRLELESARLSLLRRDTGNLHAAVGLIIDWLEKYFDNSDAGVTGILEALNDMVKVELDPPLPDINASLDALRTVINRDAMTIPDFTGPDFTDPDSADPDSAGAAEAAAP